MQALIPLTDVEKMQQAGLPFATEDAARWAFRRRHDNGLEEAFCRVGKRVYIDAGRFFEVVRSGHAA